MPYPRALALTLAVEVPLYVLALGVAAPRVLARSRSVAVSVCLAAGLAVGVNLVTHPLVWLTLTRLDGRWPAFVAVEVAAWLVETALFAVVARRDLRLLCLTALVANAASLSAGLALG